MKDLLNIEEVAEIAQVSKSSIYWRMKNKNFPKPVKIKRTKGRGRNILNRWERDQVIKWLMEGNDPQWIKQSVEDIKAACAKVDNAPITNAKLAKELEPGLNALFGKEALQPDDAARLAEGATDFYDFEPEEPVHGPQNSYNQHLFMALVGGMLAAVIYFLFNS